ncbi:hypothetical protein OAO18_08485 [Francisellaceae bacterium]|nr:hypothetical protein [Francisellaceae bacterium]
MSRNKMKNNRVLKLVSAITLASLSAGYASQDNEVRFFVKDDVLKLSFDYMGNKVSAGQAHDNKLNTNKMVDNNYLILDFHADRYGTESVAQQYFNAINSYSPAVLGLNTQSDSIPDKMNFYFYGGLSINGASTLSQTVYIGQTHQNGNNNWWFGSLAQLDTQMWAGQGKAVMFNSYEFVSMMTATGDQYCVSQKGDSYSQFYIGRCGDQNWVNFKMKDSINSVSFNLSEDPQSNINIKSGVAYYPHLTENYMDGSTRKILFNAEKAHALDQQLAKDFIAQVGTAENMVSLGGKNTPDDLYFYLNGTMQINNSPVVNSVYLGLENDNGNNWILGSKGTSNTNDQLKVTTEDGHQYCISQDGDSHNTFDVGDCSDGSGEIPLVDNIVKLYPGSGVYDLSYQMDGFKVADGMPYQSNLTKNAMIDGHLELDFNAGVVRDLLASSDVSDSYIGNVGKYASYGRNTDADYPGSLNFYLYGQLKINDSPVINDVYFGQGAKDLLTLNWWFGSNGAQQDTNTYFMWITTQDGNKYCVSNGNENYNTFMISDKCPDNGTTPIYNDVYLYKGQGIDDIKFKIPNIESNSVMVTKGEPHSDMISQKTTNEYLKLTLNSGRHKSAEIANSFYDNFMRLYGLKAENYDVLNPDSLNFYIKGLLQINGEDILDPTAFGQGNKKSENNAGDGTINNWWVGNNKAIKDSKNGLIIHTNLRSYCISGKSGSNKFIIQNECPDNDYDKYDDGSNDIAAK